MKNKMFCVGMRGSAFIFSIFGLVTCLRSLERFYIAYSGKTDDLAALPFISVLGLKSQLGYWDRMFSFDIPSS
jgi:hypothetical protein